MMMMLACAMALLAAACLALYSRYRTRRIMDSLNRMLDCAMDGTFGETRFDESLLSAVEAKLARYLAASVVSAKNLKAEKDAVKTLVADISHQTKTPIANLLLYAQLLQEQPLPEESAVCARALGGQAEKLQTLIEALVKVSRLESGIIALRPAEGPLAPMAQAAIAQLAPKAARKGMEISTGDLSGRAVFDPRWTEEALFNLLDNAVKYTPPGGRVFVQVRQYPMFAAVEVADSGPGIPEEEQAKIFSRFYRSPAHAQTEGVGIGLYLARQIAQGQGGYIKVSSSPGAGSVFALYLPREQHLSKP